MVVANGGNNIKWPKRRYDYVMCPLISSVYIEVASCPRISEIVTGPEKTGLTYLHTQNAPIRNMVPISFFCVCYPISVSCIEFLRIVCIYYDEICVKMLCCQVEILHLKD